MDRHPRFVLALSICPICFDSAGALTDGARTGAALLAIVVTAVLVAMARFAARLR